MTTFIPCPAPGIMLNGAHITGVPAHLTSNDLQTFDAMREHGVMCPVCNGNGQVRA